jgi:hypothetical protein
VTPSTTCEKEVSIAGTAEAGATVFVIGGLSPIATDPDPLTGRFCVPVQLNPGQTNELIVRAQHPDKGVSNPVTVTVVQNACTGGGDDAAPQNTVEQEPSKNVALHAPVQSKDVPEEGNDSLITDNDTTTFALWADWPWVCWSTSYDGWVWVKLEKLTELKKIVIQWRDAKGIGIGYGQEYKILISPMADPGEPSLTNGKWIELRNVIDGDGGKDTFNLDSEIPVAQHVALWLIQDGRSTVSNWTLCSNDFAVSEVQVWDMPKTVSSPSTPSKNNVCAQ